MLLPWEDEARASTFLLQKRRDGKGDVTIHEIQPLFPLSSKAGARAWEGSSGGLKSMFYGNNS